MEFNNINKKIKLYALILFLIYIFVLAYLVFWSPRFGRSEVQYRNYNIVPFKTIISFIKYGDTGMKLTNIIGNIIIFMPIGWFMPILIKRTKKLISVFNISLSFSLFIEVMQYNFYVGAFDVDDVILNTFGGVIGYLMAKFVLNIKII